MNSKKEILGFRPLSRSKSLCSLSDTVNSDVMMLPRSIDYHRINQSSTSYSSAGSSAGEECDQLADSGVCDKTFDEELHGLEQKIDRLTDLFQEQCRLLSTMKDELRSSRAMVERAELEQNDIFSELVNKAMRQSAAPTEGAGAENGRAKCLLDAIEARQGSVDSEIQEVLISFLQSEELRSRMVQATAESVKGVVAGCLSRDVAALYLPLLEHSHRRLRRHVTHLVEDAFRELEQYSSCLSKSVYKMSRSMQRAVSRHRDLLDAATDPDKQLVTTLQCTVEELLSTELKQWRQKVLEAFTSLPDREPPPVEHPPPGPSRNIIDQLMVSIEIERGDVNSAFERALSAGNLSLVMAACHGAARGPHAAPLRLRPPLLLSLMQQLSTDLLQDTELKCRYLEDALMNLDPLDPLTREHLPLVVGEVHKHLSKFLATYPAHVAKRRVSLIVMTADNLLKLIMS